MLSLHTCMIANIVVWHSSNSQNPHTSITQIRQNPASNNSGASQHLCNSRAYIADYEPLTNKKVLLGDNRIIPVRGHGRVDVHIPLGGRSTLANFNGVLYVPDIAVNLLSVSQMTLSGLPGVVQQTALNYQVHYRPRHRM